jgi:hypothetical protein
LVARKLAVGLVEGINVAKMFQAKKLGRKKSPAPENSLAAAGRESRPPQ